MPSSSNARFWCQTRLAFLWTVLLFASANGEASGNASLLAAISSNKNCLALNRVMLEQSDACRCFDSPSFIINTDPIDIDLQDENDRSAIAIGDDPLSWIGCSKEKMPAIFKALTALPNETNLTQLWIWDSFMPMIPSKTFAKVRPSKLIIERCRTGDFSGIDVFGPLSDRLVELELKNNVLRDVSAELFSPLRRLVRLDLSVNQITRVTNTTFGASLSSLRALSLYRNHLSQIADGSLDNLQQLRSLNLANNRLSRISAATFGKLGRLEYLSLENNRITEIEENAFLHLTRLRRLNLGGNRLTIVHFPSKMPYLRQLFLNNNSLQSLGDIRTAAGSMPRLETMHLDENKLKSLESVDQNGLQRWPSLRVLSLASNQLTALKAPNFDGLQNLHTLSLQGNRLTRLDDDQSGSGPFTKLTSLKELFLSQNHLSELGARTFEGLVELSVLTVARNKLESVDEKAFDGFKRLDKLFLNDNNLKCLSNSTFDVIQSTLSVISLSDNLWRCDCRLAWLAAWIGARENSIMVDSRQTQCVEQQHQEQYTLQFVSKPLADVAGDLVAVCESNGAGGGPAGRNPYGPGLWEGEAVISSSNNVWITVLGIVLGVVSIFILLAVSYLYFQEAAKGGGAWRVGDSRGVTSAVLGRWTASGVLLRSEHALRRVPSDMVNLIPKCATNSSSSAASAIGEKM